MSPIKRLTENGWSLDKRIPLALIIFLTVQAGTAIAAAATVWERVNDLEEYRLEHTQETKEQKMPERMAVIETILRRIDNKLQGN